MVHLLCTFIFRHILSKNIEIICSDSWYYLATLTIYVFLYFWLITCAIFVHQREQLLSKATILLYPLSSWDGVNTLRDSCHGFFSSYHAIFSHNLFWIYFTYSFITHNLHRGKLHIPLRTWRTHGVDTVNNVIEILSQHMFFFTITVQNVPLDYTSCYQWHLIMHKQ